MEAILTVAVMAVIVVGIFMAVKSDASPSHKAMLMLIILVVGVPGFGTDFARVGLCGCGFGHRLCSGHTSGAL